jgi:hypothetical protein
VSDHFIEDEGLRLVGIAPDQFWASIPKFQKIIADYEAVSPKAKQLLAEGEAILPQAKQLWADIDSVMPFVKGVFAILQKRNT